MKYNIGICAILKDETPYLFEWVEHHLGIERAFRPVRQQQRDPAKQTLEAYVRKESRRSSTADYHIPTIEGIYALFI